MRRIQQRIVAYVLPELAQAIVKRFGVNAQYIGDLSAQALLSMSVIDRKLHPNEINDSIQFLASLRDYKLLTMADFDKYRDLLRSRIDNQNDTTTVLTWAKKMPVELWKFHRDNAQQLMFGVTDQQHSINQIVFTLSGLSLISYAFLYVMMSDLKIDPKELQLLQQILMYFEKPGSLLHYINQETAVPQTSVSITTKKFLGTEFRTYSNEFIVTGVLPVELMQRITYNTELHADVANHAAWTVLIDEITEVNPTIIIDQNYFVSNSKKQLNIHEQMKMPLEGTIEQARLNLLMEQDVNKVDLTDDSNFLVAKDLNVETIEVLTSLIEDEDEQVDVASKLYDMVLDEVGSVPDSPETDDDIVITDDDIVITDATPLRAKGTWNIVLQQLMNEPKVTYQLIEECIARNVSIEERIDAYRYIMIKLRTSKKRIYDQDVEEGVKVASSTMDMQHIQMLVHDINTRMRNAVFAKYESEYESTYLYHALLSAGEERDLCVARNMLKEQLLLTNNQRDVVLINQIDEEIRAMLINYNYRLVMRNAIMQSVHIHHLELMDLFQEGCIGLIKAIDKFDIAKEVRISTYATWWIRQSIGRAIDDRDRSIRLPVHFLLVIRRYNKFMYLFENANPGMVPSDEFVAKELNILIKDIPKIKYWNQRIISLNTPVGDDSTTSISDYIEDDSDIITAVVRTLLAESIWRALQDCTDRQRFILIRRFGLDGGGVRTLKEIGEELGVTRESVRQHEFNALKKLRLHHQLVANYM